MRDAKLEAEDKLRWNHSFMIAATIHNYHRDPKRSAVIKTDQFYPWGKRSSEAAPPPTKEQRAMLRKMFPGKKRA